MKVFFFLLSFSLLTMTSCARRDAVLDTHEVARVLATTTIIGDIVSRIAGDAVVLEVLLPYNADPHDYILRPADLATVSNAHLIFINGAGLEGQMESALRRAARQARVVSLDRNITPRFFDEMPSRDHVHSDSCEHGPMDPHFWTDPNMVMIWADTIAEELSLLIPEAEKDFHRHATKLKKELATLDKWIADQVEIIDETQRLLVTDHLSMGYFSDRYGFKQKGVIIRSFDSMAQPSAREIAQLVDVLRTHDIPAVFVGASVNPRLAERISQDTGKTIAILNSGALTGPDGNAPDYFAYMKSNVEVLVAHLGHQE